MTDAAEVKVRFPLGVRQALSWALNVMARNGYVAPCVSSMMGGGRSTGGGLTLLEKHGEAAFIVGIVDREPLPYQQIIWFNAGVLPRATMESLAVAIAPQVIRQMSTGAYNRRAVQMAILRTQGIGPGYRALRDQTAEPEKRTTDRQAWEFSQAVAFKLEALSKVAEANIERIMIERGLV